MVTLSVLSIDYKIQISPEIGIVISSCCRRNIRIGWPPSPSDDDHGAVMEQKDDEHTARPTRSDRRNNFIGSWFVPMVTEPSHSCSAKNICSFNLSPIFILKIRSTLSRGQASWGENFSPDHQSLRESSFSTSSPTDDRSPWLTGYSTRS